MAVASPSKKPNTGPKQTRRRAAGTPYITRSGVVSLGMGALGAGLALAAVEIASPILLGVGTLVTAGGAVVKVTDTFRRSRDK